MSEAEAGKLGGVTEAPPRNEVEWTNPRTGMTQRVDRGLDPSWAGNPGRDRPRLLAEIHAAGIEGIGKLAPAVAREAIRQAVESPLLERQLAPMERADPPKGPLPVGWLEPAGRRELGGSGGVVALTQRGARHTRKDHPDVTSDDIRRALPAILREGERSAGAGQRDGLPYLRLDWDESDGTAWRAVVKRDGDLVFLATVFRVGRPRGRRG